MSSKCLGIQPLSLVFNLLISTLYDHFLVVLDVKSLQRGSHLLALEVVSIIKKLPNNLENTK